MKTTHSGIARRAGLPRLLNTARRLTILAMLASLFTLPFFRAEAQPVLTPAYITVKSYMASGCYSNTMGFEYRTGNYIVDWTAGQGGTSYAYSLHAVPTVTYTNFSLLVTYDPWNMDFIKSLTVWPTNGTGTNTTITGFLGINPQIPTTVTNYFLVPGPPGSSPPYYYVTNIFLIPPMLPVTNITIGWDQPNPLPPWPHYIDLVSSYSMYGGWQTGIATNTEIVTIDLHTGLGVNNAYFSRPTKFTWISVTANNGAIPFELISAGGEPVNADNQVLIEDYPNNIVDVTPSVLNYSNYTFNAGVAGHKIVKFKRSYHPEFALGPYPFPDINALRDKFDEGSRVLALDNDTWPTGWLKDNDSKFDTNSPNYQVGLVNDDDVPFPVEFEITDLGIFPPAFWGTNFFSVPFIDDFNQLSGLPGHIKQVNWLYANNPSPFNNDPSQPNGISGKANYGSRSTVVLASVSHTALIHEWGHMCNLRHRGELFNGVALNPGNPTNAIMRSSSSGGTKINRSERTAYQGWQNDVNP